MYSIVYIPEIVNYILQKIFLICKCNTPGRAAPTWSRPIPGRKTAGAAALPAQSLLPAGRGLCYNGGRQGYRFWEGDEQMNGESGNYELVRINGNSWRVEDSGVRFFLLTGTERALLVDSGRNVSNAREIAAGLTALPLALLNTHADGDHVGSNGQSDSFYMHPDEEPNYRRGGRGGRILPVSEGTVIDLGGRELEVIHLPGHTPGSIALLDRTARVLISGDPIQDGRIYMFGRFRNLETYLRSLEHLQRWRDRFDEIWPSHGSIPVPPALIDRLHDGAADILAGRAEGRPEELFGSSILAYDLGFATFLCDR